MLCQLALSLASWEEHCMRAGHHPEVRNPIGKGEDPTSPFFQKHLTNLPVFKPVVPDSTMSNTNG